MRKTIALSILLFLVVKINAQGYIKGQALDREKKPLPFCTVVLLRSFDQVSAKGTVADDRGNFEFLNPLPGDYRIRVLNAGSSLTFTQVIKVDSLLQLDLEPLIFDPGSKDLGEVSVVAIQNPVEFKNGNLVANIEGSPLAVGNSVYDLISRLPGVMVNDDEITIQGVAGTKIFIDDRQQQLSGSQLINLLRTMNASSVQKIEIMKNPPVKYDAAGTAGIINIKTKKIKVVGFSGNFNNNYTQSFYPNYISSFDLNYKGKTVNLFSGVSTGLESFKKEQYFNRKVLFNGNTSEVNQHYIEKQQNPYQSFTFGADWFINRSNVIGVKVFTWGGNERKDRNGDIKVVNSDLGYDHSRFGYHRENPWSYTNTNLNYEHSFDTLGTRLTMSADYTYNYDVFDGTYFNYFEGPTATVRPKIFDANNYMYVSLGAARIDLEKQLNKDLKLETGVKGAYTQLTSNYFVVNMDSAGSMVYDTALTNNFTYQELIPSAYVNLQQSFKKISLQAGLRAEDTEVKTYSQLGNATFNRSYFNLFPLLSVDYKASKDHSWQTSYKRRLERPSYFSFNPNRFFRNYLISDLGNPNLMPVYINTGNVSYNYKGKFNASLAYNKIDNIFFSYAVQNDSTKEIVNYMKNLRDRRVVAGDLYFQHGFFKWWTSTFNTTGYYFEYDGTVNDKPYKTKQYSLTTYVNNQFVFKNNLKAEITLHYAAPFIEYLSRREARWALEMAVRKSFFDKKLNLVFAGYDLFFTWITKNRIDFYNLQSTTAFYNDSRRFRISINYNFGKLKVKQRQVKNNQEERDRLGK